MQYGNTQTNIVIVQLSSLVQTRADFIYNLTCTILPPDDATVKSGYIGANHIQHPVPIEYLPAQHKLKAQVRLIIEHKVWLIELKVSLSTKHGWSEFQGRPTTTIVVGDQLKFKLKPLVTTTSQESGEIGPEHESFVADIFATNVRAKDPYTGRAVELIDSRG